MIDLIYKTVQTIINKENNGYCSPTEFNRIATLVQRSIFNSYFDNENRDKNRKNRGLTNSGYGNLDFNERHKITIFAEKTSIITTSGVATLPEDFYFAEDKGVSVTTTGRVIDECERSEINSMLNSSVGVSEIFPVYEASKNFLTVYPSTINSIDLRYIRTPKNPMWTYEIVSGKEMFNPNLDYQDFELHESEFENIVLRILSYLSITIREGEVTKVAEGLKDKNTSNENN
jgi:hypothetical protein